MTKKTCKPPLRPVAAALLAALAGAAAAQPSTVPQQSTVPWYVGAEQAFTHDSNVFRRPDDQSDVISSTSVLGGVNLPFGRQALRADARVRYNKYKDQDQLDHTDYRIGARLDWQTIERLSGFLDVSSRQQLAVGDLLATLGDDERTTARVDNATFAARLGATSVLALEGRVGHQRVDYETESSDPAFVQGIDATGDYKQNFASLGVLYRPSGLLTLGLSGRVTKGDFHHDPAGDEYDRKDIDLTAVWEPTGISRVTARLSATDEEHTVATRKDISGATGEVQWDWRPTGKLRFLSNLVRDSGSQIAFAQVRLPTGEILTATAPEARVATSVGVRAFYEFSAKIRFDAELRHVERDFRENLIADDRTSIVSIGAQWDPTRSVLLGCNLSHQTRSSSSAAREYDANIASCFARFLLQG